jgi:5-(carboxyamino)imidazole ribonucleotide mutase
VHEDYNGWDSVLSILQMPAGIPVATVALNGAKNAGILAAQILGSNDPEIAERMDLYKNELKQKIEKSAEGMKGKGFHSSF